MYMCVDLYNMPCMCCACTYIQYAGLQKIATVAIAQQQHCKVERKYTIYSPEGNWFEPPLHTGLYAPLWCI